MKAFAAVAAALVVAQVDRTLPPSTLPPSTPPTGGAVTAAAPSRPKSQTNGASASSSSA
jgi:hypothetical protein